MSYIILYIIREEDIINIIEYIKIILSKDITMSIRKRKERRMLIDIAKRLNVIDEDLQLLTQCSDKEYCCEIRTELLGTLYSITTCNLIDLYIELDKFVSCLEDTTGAKFQKFLEELLAESDN